MIVAALPRRRLVHAACTAAALLAGCGEPSGPPARPAPVEAAYDLEGRPRGSLPRIQGWCVAIVAIDSPSPDPAPSSRGEPSARLVRPSLSAWPTIASLLTGLRPSQHGVGTDGAAPAGFARAWITAAEVLSNAYGFETAAFLERAWPPYATSLLQGFPTPAGPGEVSALLEAWQRGRRGDVPFLVYVQTSAEGAGDARLGEVLARAAGARPLLTLTTEVGGAPPSGIDTARAWVDDVALLAGLWAKGPPGYAPPRSGLEQRGLLDDVLRQLGAPPPGGAAARAPWDSGEEAVAAFEWIAGTRDTQGTASHWVFGVRAERYTYCVVYDVGAGTVLEHLTDRRAPDPGAASPPVETLAPRQGLHPRFCRAVEEARDVLWGRVDDVRWRLTNGYVSGIPMVRGARPAPLCDAPR